jgi:hypothetical protein
MGGSWSGRVGGVVRSRDVKNEIDRLDVAARFSAVEPMLQLLAEGKPLPPDFHLETIFTVAQELDPLITGEFPCDRPGEAIGRGNVAHAAVIGVEHRLNVGGVDPAGKARKGLWGRAGFHASNDRRSTRRRTSRILAFSPLPLSGLDGPGWGAVSRYSRSTPSRTHRNPV